MTACNGTKLATCLERATWDVVSEYVNLDNPLDGTEYVSACDDHLAENVRWVMSWHRDTKVTVQAIVTVSP